MLYAVSIISLNVFYMPKPSTVSNVSSILSNPPSPDCSESATIKRDVLLLNTDDTDTCVIAKHWWYWHVCYC